MSSSMAEVVRLQKAEARILALEHRLANLELTVNTLTVSPKAYQSPLPTLHLPKKEHDKQ